MTTSWEERGERVMIFGRRDTVDDVADAIILLLLLPFYLTVLFLVQLVRRSNF